ncbi:MAG: SpoIIE family protein phosphatase [Spirochaetes bacterium]|jgi:sigma-B regulation protein RsbU (phosphoserine phosphatase)|nr:SpoIIE family protein phosphatase [Spirochaetota bacterium]
MKTPETLKRAITAAASLWKGRLSVKLTASVLLSTGFIFCSVILYYYYSSKAIVLDDAQTNARNLAQSVINRMMILSNSIETLTAHTARSLEVYSFRQDRIRQELGQFVANNRDIYGSAVAFEPWSHAPDRKYYAPYCHRRGESVEFTVLGGPEYDYFSMGWYSRPKESGKAMWSEPYFDRGGGNIIMTTYSVPFYSGTGPGRKFRGVVTADVSIEWIHGFVSTLKFYDTGYAFLVSGEGTVVSHPNASYIFSMNINEFTRRTGDGRMIELCRKITKGDAGYGFARDFFTKKESFIYYAPIIASGASMASMVIFVPEEELFGDIRKLARNVFAIGIVGAAALVLVISAISRRITRPIHSLAGITREIARGNLDIEVPCQDSGDEIGTLALSFTSMKTALREYIADLRETTAAKERIESELSLARAIQQSFLPRGPLPAGPVCGCDAFGAIEMARQVGGDLYDFFMLDGERLFFLIGDVSDKGMAAALFMAVTRTLFRAAASPLMEPSAILERVNPELCRDNESSMFVTLFCAVYHTRTGELRYSNAGHNPPLILKTDRTVVRLASPSGIALGAKDGAGYETGSAALGPGDVCLAYTDGITEAMDPSGAFYTEPRLAGTLASAEDFSPRGLVERVLGSVRDFAGGAPQSDDMTLFCLRNTGRGNP